MTALGSQSAWRYGRTLLIAALWGTAFLFVTLAEREGVPPISIAAGRGVLAAFALGAWLLVVGTTSTVNARLLVQMGVLSLINGLVPNILIAVAVARISTASAAVIQSTTPLIVAALTPLVLPADRPTRRQRYGLAVGFAGVLVVIGHAAVPGASTGSKAGAWGIVAMTGAAVSYAVTGIYLRRWPALDAVTTGFGQQALAGLVASSLAVVKFGSGAMSLSTSALFALAGLAIVSTAIPMVLYFRLLKDAPAHQAALVQYLLPVAAIVYGASVLGERVTLTTLVGGVVTLAGVWLASSGGGPSARPPAERNRA